MLTNLQEKSPSSQNRMSKYWKYSVIWVAINVDTAVYYKVPTVDHEIFGYKAFLISKWTNPCQVLANSDYYIQIPTEEDQLCSLFFDCLGLLKTVKCSDTESTRILSQTFKLDIYVQEQACT